MDIRMMLAAQAGKSAPKMQGGATDTGQFAQNLANAGRHGGNDLAKLVSAGQQTGADLATLAKQAKAHASAAPQPGKAGQANALAEALAAHGLSSAAAETLQAQLPEVQADLEAIRQRIEAVMADRSATSQDELVEAAPLSDSELEEALAALVDEGTLDPATAKAIEAAIQRDETGPQTADETTVAALQQALAAVANDNRQARTASAGERTAAGRTASTAPTSQRPDAASLETLLGSQRREVPAADNGASRPAAQSLDAKAVEAALMTERQNAMPRGLGGESGRNVTNEAASALAGGALPTQGSATFSQSMASANPSATGGTPGQATLSAPVQSPAWPGQLGQQLVQFARQGAGEQQIEMRLHPAELGPLSVTLKMTEQGAQAQFLSAHAQVRQAIEQALPQLRDALAEQGIDLSETSVGEQRQHEGQAFAGNEGGRNQAGVEPAADGSAAAEGIPASDGVATEMTLNGRVNLYA
ncbi:flagellar hook-length control protein FliK [Billgrantia gudaonensis]|uniref:Flagellar hook-length control protein FliK n=1 Tax=Billgrantia gudaonensis TaxID=376427 RepID=A0A1G8T1W8_9GAMM|nr:flagellar hook-length control protein FliK [Halomonas gudaonensis]SDJ35417.1 flagellar hook-length control protein FliK [Halomonas gudaonensis]